MKQNTQWKRLLKKHWNIFCLTLNEQGLMKLSNFSAGIPLDNYIHVTHLDKNNYA